MNINYYKWEALISLLGEKRKKKHVGGKKERKKFMRLPGQVLNSHPSRFLIQYTNALS